MSLKKEIERYSKLNGYLISTYQEIKCSCGENEFHLYSDDDEGGAYLTCPNCKKEIDIHESRKYIKEYVNNICNCDNKKLNIGIGVAYYSGSNDPKWIYVGAHCNQCGLNGVYVDWKEN